MDAERGGPGTAPPAPGGADGPSGAGLEARLSAWQRAGLLTAEQAAAIADHERRHPTAAGATSVPRDRTTAAEAIGYVGAALVLGAVVLFVGEFWQRLTAGGQLSLAVLVTAALAGAGAALRGADAPALTRLTSVFWAGAVAGVAWCTAIVTDGMLAWSADDVAQAVGVTTVASALPLYLLRPRALPQLTLLAALLTLTVASLTRTELLVDGFWLALPVAALGVVWLLLGEGGYLRPGRLAAGVGGALALLALQVGAFEDRRTLALVLALALAAGLVTYAVTSGEVLHLAVGSVGAFVLVPQLVFELFGDAIGAPATLLVVGIVLVLLAVGLGRARREVAPAGGGA